MGYIQLSLFGKMSPELLAATEAKISAPCWKLLPASHSRTLQYLDLTEGGGSTPDTYEGAAGLSLGDCSTLNIGECPSEERESLLSWILEENAPEKYYLSAKACEGILRRASRRGKELSAPLKEALEQTIAQQGGASVFDARGNGGGDIAPTMTGDHNGHMSDYTALAVIAYMIGSYYSEGMKSPNPRAGVYEAKTACALDAFGFANPARNQGGIAICEQINAYGISRATFNQGSGAHYGLGVEAELEPTITSQGPAAVCVPVMCRATAQANAETLTEKSPCLNCNHEQPIVFVPHWIVRRLTPLECERLQGYPDGWTDIGEWIDGKGKKHKPADTPRYKALGNSIALPQWWWLTCKMAEYLPADATLGSLFDGIGGFPLVWETRHGKGTALWASEIEEFCIAVTKARFACTQ